MSQRVLALVNRTVLEFAAVFSPIVPLPEFVNSVPFVRMSRVKGAFVPTMIPPEIVFVTWLSVTVAPSLTT